MSEFSFDNKENKNIIHTDPVVSTELSDTVVVHYRHPDTSCYQEDVLLAMLQSKVLGTALTFKLGNQKEFEEKMQATEVSGDLLTSQNAVVFHHGCKIFALLNTSQFGGYEMAHENFEEKTVALFINTSLWSGEFESSKGHNRAPMVFACAWFCQKFQPTKNVVENTLSKHGITKSSLAQWFKDSNNPLVKLMEKEIRRKDLALATNFATVVNLKNQVQQQEQTIKDLQQESVKESFDQLVSITSDKLGLIGAAAKEYRTIRKDVHNTQNLYMQQYRDRLNFDEPEYQWTKEEREIMGIAEGRLGTTVVDVEEATEEALSEILIEIRAGIDLLQTALQSLNEKIDAAGEDNEE